MLQLMHCTPSRTPRTVTLPLLVACAVAAGGTATVSPASASTVVPSAWGSGGKRDIQRKAIPPGAALEMQNLHAIAGFGAKAQHTHGAAKNFRVISFQFNFVGHSIPPYDPFET